MPFDDTKPTILQLRHEAIESIQQNFEALAPLLNPTAGTYLPLVGGQMSGAIQMSGAAGTVRAYQWQTGNGLRWQMVADAIAETGSNAGSDWELLHHDDSGNTIGAAVTIARTNGNVGIGQSYEANWKLAVAGGIVSTGTSAAVTFQQRDASRRWSWYATSNLARLNQSDGIDVLSIDIAGNASMLGNLDVGGNIDAAGGAISAHGWTDDDDIGMFRFGSYGYILKTPASEIFQFRGGINATPAIIDCGAVMSGYVAHSGNGAAIIFNAIGAMTTIGITAGGTIGDLTMATGQVARIVVIGNGSITINDPHVRWPRNVATQWGARKTLIGLCKTADTDILATLTPYD